MSGARAFLVAAAISAALAVRAGPAFAQPSAGDVAQARRLFQAGVEHLRQQRWSDACESFAQSNAVLETAETHLNIAVCSGELGRLLDQSEHLRTFLRLAGPDVEQGRVEDATRLLSEIAPRVPTLAPRVHAAGDAELTVEVDGEPIPRAAWGAPRPVNPGAVVVRVTGPRYEELQQTHEVREGQHLQVDLRPVPLPEATVPVVAPTPEEASDEGPRVPRWVWWVTGSVLVATGLAVGAFFLFRDTDLPEPVYPPGTREYDALRRR